MKLKEKIKSKVDKMEAAELRQVDILIDSLEKKRSLEKKTGRTEDMAFLTVIELMAPNFLASEDILSGRQEEI